MATTFRFVDDSGTTRLDLNDETGWVLGRGLDFGVSTLEKKYLQQTPFDGATLASSFRPPVTMTVPLLLMTQSSADALRTKFEALATELNRAQNVLEWRGTGMTQSVFIDTYRADVPSLIRGVDSPSPYLFRHSAGLVVCQIDRAPLVRLGTGGATAFL